MSRFVATAAAVLLSTISFHVLFAASFALPLIGTARLLA